MCPESGVWSFLTISSVITDNGSCEEIQRHRKTADNKISVWTRSAKFEGEDKDVNAEVVGL